MELHMREFDGTTFGMSVEASSPAFKRMKKNAFTGKVTPPMSGPPAVSALLMWLRPWAPVAGW